MHSPGIVDKSADTCLFRFSHTNSTKSFVFSPSAVWSAIEEGEMNNGSTDKDSTVLEGKVPVSQVTSPRTVRVVKDQRHSVVTSNEPTIADGL